MKKTKIKALSLAQIGTLEARDLPNQIQALETRAHRLGLHITGHALNNAKNASGWETAGDIEMAGKAAIGVRPGK